MISDAVGVCLLSRYTTFAVRLSYFFNWRFSCVLNAQVSEFKNLCNSKKLKTSDLL